MIEGEKKTSPSKRMTAPEPLSNTSAMVASEVSLPENVFYPNMFKIDLLKLLLLLLHLQVKLPNI